MTERSRVTDRATSCFAHGLAHLMSELGQEEGIRTAMGIIASMADGGVTDGWPERSPPANPRTRPREPRVSARPGG